MSFQKAATITPSPADYRSEDSDQRMSFRSSMLKLEADSSKLMFRQPSQIHIDNLKFRDSLGGAGET